MNLNSSLIILFLNSVAIILNSGLVEALTKYEEINKYLEDHVQDSDPQTNLKAASDWLESANLKDDPKLVEALKLFTSIADIPTVGEEKCGKRTYEILVQNDRETENRAHGSLNTLNRVERVVSYYNSLNSRECANIYPQKYVKMYENLDEVLIRRVEEYANDVAIELLIGISVGTTFLNREVYKSRILDSRPLGGMLINGITRGLRLDGATISSGNIKELLKEYILKPCEYYIKHIGEEIFLPAGYSYMWNFGVQNKEKDFYKGFARYRICAYTIDNQDLLVRDVLEWFQTMERKCEKKTSKVDMVCVWNLLNSIMTKFKPTV